MVVRLSWNDESVTSDGENNQIEVASNILEFDAVERLSIDSRAEVTQRIIENGAPLSDHKSPLPRKITLDGLVTNTPLGDPLPNGKGTKSSIVATTKATEIGNLLVYSGEFDSVQDVTDSLNDLLEKPIFVTLETPNRVYERVTLVSLAETTTSPSFNGKRFNVTFQEVNIGDTRFVEVPVPKKPRGTSDRDNSSSDTELSERVPPTSWASELGQGVGAFGPIQ